MAPCFIDRGLRDFSHPTWVLRTSSSTSSTTNWKSCSVAPMALQVGFFRAMSQEPRMPFGCSSRGRCLAEWNTSCGMSIFIGQTYRQRQHMVQNHGQFDFRNLLVHAEGGHAQEFARVHPSNPGRRAAR